MNARDPDESILEMAGCWLARRDRGLTAEESAAFSAWYGADVRHAQALARLEGAWSRASVGAANDRREAIRAGVRDRVRARRRRWVGGGGLAVAMVAVVLSFGPPNRWLAEPRTKVAAAIIAPERRVLPDGSVAEYPAGTAVAVRFDAAVRRIELAHGEAHFEVKSDPARPFVVVAGGVAVRAVGTAFTVRSRTADTTVVVTHGRVAVSEAQIVAAGREPLALIEAGQGIRVQPARAGAEPTVAPLGPEEAAQQLAWRERRVEFSGAPLAEVLVFVNAHNRVQLVLEAPELAQVPLSGVFRLNDPDDFANMLERGFGVVLDRGQPDRIGVRLSR